MTTESVVRCIENNTESGHAGLILGAFSAKFHKKQPIDFSAVGEAARRRYGERISVLYRALEIEFDRAGYNLRIAANPPEPNQYATYFRWTFTGGNTTSGGW